MNGADRLCDVLLASGVDVCFANPGTSEMNFVAALDRRPAMRCVLGLFEGVVTGAADGYARMADRPAATLLHTGPGLANGLANMHNARRVRTPMINVVGDHASYHLALDAPLTSDIEGLARPMSHFVRRITGPADVGAATVEAYTASLALPGIATLILPADSAWGELADSPLPTVERPVLAPVSPDTLADVAEALRKAGQRGGLLLAGAAARADALEDAGRIAAGLGTRLFGEVLCGRIERGGDRVPIERIPYPIDWALDLLRDIDVLVLVNAPEPVAFFAYPGKPGRLLREDCAVIRLSAPSQDARSALATLAASLGADAPIRRPQTRPDILSQTFTGPLTNEAIAATVTRMMPDNAIICEEALTSVPSFYALSAHAPAHDYLMNTGGSIGIGIPLAIGAAIACPDRKVINLQADGSGMYTVQGLWTQARENLDIVTVIFSNRAYAILKIEMQRVGITQPGRNATRMLSLDEPALDWVSLARGMGVDGARAQTCEEFTALLTEALQRRGPFLIEAVL